MANSVQLKGLPGGKLLGAAEPPLTVGSLVLLKSGLILRVIWCGESVFDGIHAALGGDRDSLRCITEHEIKGVRLSEIAVILGMKRPEPS